MKLVQTMLAGALSFSSCAMAQTQPTPQSQGFTPSPQALAVLQACRPDIEKFCKDLQPGGGRIASCLRDHANELSAGCKAAAAAARQQNAR